MNSQPFQIDQLDHKASKLIGSIIILIALVGGLSIFAALTLNTVQAQGEPKLETGLITINGTGRISVQPDIAVIQMGVQTDASSAGAALTDNSTKMQSLLSYLSDAGINEEDIQTHEIYLTPTYNEQQNDPGASLAITGYRAVNTIEIRIDQLESLGSLLDSAVAAGATNIHSIRFDTSNTTSAYQQAREVALENANQIARDLAGLTDRELGEIYSIEEVEMPGTLSQSEVGLSDLNGSAPISPGNLTVEVILRVSWLLN